MCVYSHVSVCIIHRTLGYFSTSFTPHTTICVYTAAAGLTIVLTDAVKLYVGYLRPVFYDICVPDDTYESCTNDDDSDARKSFPSGHASLSFCGLGLLSFYLERRFGVSKFRIPNSSRPPTTVGFTRIVSILCKTPLVLAGFIAASRVVDNKHFPADVVGGSVLGFSLSFWIDGIWNNELS